MKFKIVSAVANEDYADCRFTFQTANFGWNRNAQFQWVNISYNEPLPVKTGRFAPKDLTSGDLFEEYLCEPWCTWTMPVYIEMNDPSQGTYIDAQFSCYYNNEAPTNNPRVISRYYTNSGVDQVFNLYPIESHTNHYYITKALNNSSLYNYNMGYKVLGSNGTNIGAFGWGLAPYGGYSSGIKCAVNQDPS